ncbi:SDR family NAD(P)-dependent oxidoreductase [Actinocatenispora rupis]|nr:SDR family NAD(P)-dependent oxidoreductase [Actinocatenispora rupis]
MPTALVTGATAGIGAAFARRLALARYDLVLVARGADRLSDTAAELADRWTVAVETIPADLSTAEGCAAVEARLADADRPVDMLVNNAGISLHRPFPRNTADDEERLLRLNVVAVMRLTHAALGVMTQRGRGAIVNVSSVAGFGSVMPGSTYPASKAWVTNFSDSVGQLARRHGVKVMALCPGFTHSEFHDNAGIDMGEMPAFLWLDADQVVAAGLRDLRRGKLVSVPTVRYKVASAALAHLPRAVLHRVPSMGGSRTRE